MMANYWNNLNERERWLAGTGSLCVLLYMFYLLLYAPLTTAVDTKSKQLIEKQETLTWMQQIRQQQNKQKAAQLITNAKLLALIDKRLTNNALRQFAYQLQQIGPGDIQLSYERVPFNQFLTWLWSLSNDYAVTLKQLTAEHTDTPGVAKLMIIISAK